MPCVAEIKESEIIVLTLIYYIFLKPTNKKNPQSVLYFRLFYLTYFRILLTMKKHNNNSAIAKRKKNIFPSSPSPFQSYDFEREKRLKPCVQLLRMDVVSEYY